MFTREIQLLHHQSKEGQSKFRKFTLESRESDSKSFAAESMWFPRIVGHESNKRVLVNDGPEKEGSGGPSDGRLLGGRNSFEEFQRVPSFLRKRI